MHSAGEEEDFLEFIEDDEIGFEDDVFVEDFILIGTHLRIAK